MNTDDYYKMLCDFDWFYFYSSDTNITSKGYTDESKIRQLAQSNCLFDKMHKIFYEVKYCGNKVPSYERLMELVKGEIECNL